MAQVSIYGAFDFRFNNNPGVASAVLTSGNFAYSNTATETFRVEYTDATRSTVTGFSITQYSGNYTVNVAGLNLDNGLVDRYLASGKYQSLLRVAESGNDTIIAGSSPNVNLVGGGGNDFLIMGASGKADGGEGLNTLQIASGYSIAQTGEAAFTLTSGTNVIQASDIQRIKVGNDISAFDIAGNAGQVYRLYNAAFARTPDTVGLSNHVNAYDHGSNLNAIAKNFVNSAEFFQKYGINSSNETFVTSLYFNVLKRAPDAGGFAAYTNALNAGVLDRAGALIQFSESIENHITIDPVIAVGIRLDAAYMQLG